MWLIRIDEETGLVWDDPSNDGWKAIKEFRELNKKYGIEAVTVIAMVCDFLSPYKNYNERERPGRCQEEIYGVRSKLDFENDELIVEAVKKYKALQFNVDMQHDRLNKEIQSGLIEQLSQAYELADDALIAKVNTRLQKHGDSVRSFNSKFDIEKTVNDFAVTSNGYKLTRIELDIASRKNSKFLNLGVDLKNPDTLGLNVDSDKKYVAPKNLKNELSSGVIQKKTRSTKGRTVAAKKKRK